jgi:hypothetical protein
MLRESLSRYRNPARVILAAICIIAGLSNHQATGRMQRRSDPSPRISPNGKARAALTRDRSAARVTATVLRKEGGITLSFAKGAEWYKWNSESELILDYGKFVFDWESLLSADWPPRQDPEPEAPVKTEVAHADAALREKLLVRLSAQGVKRIEDIVPSPTGSRLVIEGGWNETKPILPDTGLWIMNRDGSGLRRLTTSGGNPAWSPAGDEVAFADGDVRIINLKTRRIRTLPDLRGSYPKAGEDVHNRSIYIDAPSWSRNGKAIAASAVNVGGGWVKAADARFGRELIGELESATSFRWNERSGLVVRGYGKLVLDWSGRRFKRR